MLWSLILQFAIAWPPIADAEALNLEISVTDLNLELCVILLTFYVYKVLF
jgi:hypothetical protein